MMGLGSEQEQVGYKNTKVVKQSQSGFQLSVVKPKPDHSLTNKTTQPISNHK